VPKPTVEVLPDPEEVHVPATGAVSSTQAAVLSAPAALADALWTPAGLERLARGYWRHLRRISLGSIRVLYGADSRTVVLVAPPFRMLRFRAPEYKRTDDRAAVTWRIERGLLVAAEGRDTGRLRIELERESHRDGEAATPGPGQTGAERIRIRVEVSNFYPWLRGTGRFGRLGVWVYSQTQLRIHRRITIGFLRSLERADLSADPAASHS